MTHNDFARLLVAPGADDSLGPDADLFGRLVGTWRVRNRYRSAPGDDWRFSERTWTFAWIAGGRAVQDVIVGSDRGGDTQFAGTTVRAFDGRIGAWRVNWFGTLHANFGALTARSHGPDAIWQDGVEFTPDGEIPIRWNFSEMTDAAFSWDGWSSADGGSTWWLEQHMDAVRA